MNIWRNSLLFSFLFPFTILLVGCLQPVQIPQDVEFTFASSPTIIAHFPLNGDGTDIRGDLQLSRATFADDAPTVTGSSQHLRISGAPNEYISVRRQDDEQFVTFEESLSIAFWFRPEERNGTLLSIQQARPAGDVQLQIAQLEYTRADTANPGGTPATVTFTVSNPTHGDNLTFNRAIEANDEGWCHVAFVINPARRDNTAVVLFLNGRRAVSDSLPRSLTGDADALLRFLDIRLGANHQGGDPFRGGISDLRFEAIHLTGSQVAQQLLPEGAVLPAFDVIFDPNGATAGAPPLIRRYEMGSDLNIPGRASLSKGGYSFAGWSTARETSHGHPVLQITEPVQVFDSLTFYAQWVEFTSFEFTNGGQTGRFGPSINNLQAAYNTERYPWLENRDFFDVDEGIQIWTVPHTGTYRITAKGAQGGSSGGRGAELSGEFELEMGQKLRILVGQMGSGTAGGGGTFVTVLSGPLSETNQEDILVIAGGGGGKSGGSDASVTTSNSDGTVSNGEGGKAVNSSWNGPAGGGFFSSGEVSTGSPRGTPGSGFRQGGFGGQNIRDNGNTANGEGGFGGGGSGGGDSGAGGGGGGGYSGGSGVPDNSVGMGGGSFISNSATNITKTNDPGNSGHGSVTIELVSP